MQSPCHQIHSKSFSIHTLTLAHKSITYSKLSSLTIASAVMDSFIHRLSSSKWPSKIQAQSSATNRFIDTTEVWSEVLNILFDSDAIELKSNAIVAEFKLQMLQEIPPSSDRWVREGVDSLKGSFKIGNLSEKKWDLITILDHKSNEKVKSVEIARYFNGNI